MKKQILMSLTACIVGSTIGLSMGTPSLPIVLDKDKVQKAEIEQELLEELREYKAHTKKALKLQQLRKEEVQPATLRQVKDFKEEIKERK